MAKKFYVTTAIDYVNAKPHIGHAFEKVLADTLVRWKKIKGEKTWFLTGTDENAPKNEQAAKKADIPTKKFVDINSRFFIELCEKLDVDYDRFIRTTEEEHKKISQQIFKKVHAKGEIYKGTYEGYYCTGCEEFKTEKDLVDGKCPEHDREPEWISEEAYFFKLSKYKNKLIKFIENYIVPQERKNEILSRLKNEELRDLCVSRTGIDWGIDNPIDKKFKIYVWFDALVNYISGAEGNWPADVHVVGKGINWFHSVIWPAMLMSSGYKLPKKLLVHGYLNIEGKKMSKSLGNVIDPVELIDKYGSDAVRYSLLRCSVFDDSDYSEGILIGRLNNELADKFGNLVSRVSALAEREGLEKSNFQINLTKKQINKILKDIKKSKRVLLTQGIGPSLIPSASEFKMVGRIGLWCDTTLYDPLLTGSQLDAGGDFSIYSKIILPALVEKYLENYEFDKALSEIFTFIDFCNFYIQTKKPWETKDKKVLYELVDSIKTISILLWPFIPSTSEKISRIFGFKVGKNSLREIEKSLAVKKIKKADVLFGKINAPAGI